jgi:hypothetical protein
MFDNVQFNIADAINALMKDLGFNRSVRWYIVKRARREGVKFVTVLLPSLSKHILKCIEDGCWIPFQGPSPIKTSGKQRYTAFLADELTCIFESPLSQDCAYHLWRVRQLLDYFYKLALPFDEGCLDQSTQKFLATESSLHYDREFADRVRVTAENIFVKAKKLTFDDVAKHARFGPGTFSGYQSYVGDNLQGKKDLLDGVFPVGRTKVLPKEKSPIIAYTLNCDWSLSFLASIPFISVVGYDSVKYEATPRPSTVNGHSGFFRKSKTTLFEPLKRYFCSVSGWSLGFIASVPFISLMQATRSGRKVLKPYVPPVDYSELLFVPKDSRGPRTIVREPAHNIYMQMGFHSCFKAALEDDTNGRIQFTSQEEFRNLAERSSVTREYTTLDLSEASDSVSVGFANIVFQNFSSYTTCYKAYRTDLCMLPNGDKHRLRKLSGMGSGFTFPVMASLIYAAILTEIPKYQREDAAPLIYVYGDDIIVPTRFVKLAYSALSKAGFTVNAQKSYSRSYFRESCGGDFYHGQSVAPVRLKLQFCNFFARGSRVISNGKHSEKTVFKLERHCRELVMAGLLDLAQYYYDIIEQYLEQELVIGTRFDAVPLIRFTRQHVPCYWNNPPMVSAYKPLVSIKERTNDGFNLSFNTFLSNTDEVIFRDPVSIGLTAERYNVSLELSETDLSFTL